LRTVLERSSHIISQLWTHPVASCYGHKEEEEATILSAVLDKEHRAPESWDPYA